MSYAKKKMNVSRKRISKASTRARVSQLLHQHGTLELVTKSNPDEPYVMVKDVESLEKVARDGDWLNAQAMADDVGISIYDLVGHPFFITDSRIDFKNPSEFTHYNTSPGSTKYKSILTNKSWEPFPDPVDYEWPPKSKEWGEQVTRDVVEGKIKPRGQ